MYNQNCSVSEKLPAWQALAHRSSANRALPQIWENNATKTTLEIPDATFRKAKATASSMGIPLREFVTQAVEEKLSSSGSRQAKPWLECAGALSHLHKETRRVQKLIDDEFEQIDPEDWK